MSWLSDNYEKAALGGAAVVALALGAVVFKNKGALADAFDVSAPKKNTETGVRGLKDIVDTKNSLGEVHEVHRADIDGRKVDLFTGVQLFSKRDDQQNPVDLLKSDPVHPGIPNTWWLKYGIDPGFSDSPDRDPDEDGFTNREEFVGETNPKDFNDHPDPIVKLAVLNVKTIQFHIKPTHYGEDANGVDQSVFKIESRGGNRFNRLGAGVTVAPGDLIPFIDPFMQKRFKCVAVHRKKLPNGITEIIWEIEDLKPNKKGTKYMFDKRGNLPGAPNREFGIMDSTVELRLNALKQGGNPFTLEENSSFSLPFDAKATKKPYLLKKVDRKNLRVEVEYTDKEGNKKTHIMPYEKK